MFKSTRISRIEGRANQSPRGMFFFANRIRITRITVRGLLLLARDLRFVQFVFSKRVW